jgi:hypothetical protein
MPRVSQADRLERDLTDRLRAMIADRLTPQYVVAKSIGTLATLLKRRDKRLAEKAARSAARKAAEPKTYPCVLPDNRRGPPPGFQPGPVKPFVIPRGINRN